MMKLNLRPAIKKQAGKPKQRKPKFTAATTLFLSFLPHDMSNLQNRFMRLTKGQNYYKPHQGAKECARRVRQGKGGDCYHKRNEPGNLIITPYE